MHRRDVLFAALVTCLVAGTATACPKHSADATAGRIAPPLSQAAVVAWKPRAWMPPARVQPAAGGLRVERDPVDGTLSMPAHDPSEAMLMEGERERRPVSVVRLSNGAYRAQLGEDFAEFAVVRLGPDGKPRWTCVSGPDGVERFMRPGVAPKREPAPGTVWEDK